MKMILVCYGTRPEVIKVAPVIKALQVSDLPFKTVFTGQHRELYEDVKFMVPTPDYELDVMQANQGINGVLALILNKLDVVIKKEKASMVIVQGDTSTVLASALCAFNNRVPVGHIEAGLRTFDLASPFPEEANRQLVSTIANLNWAPTELAAKRLEAEGAANVLLTGNTVVDASQSFEFPIVYGNEILVTLHRRENFINGKIEGMFKQIETLAVEHPNLNFIFPMHPNPNIQKYRRIFKKVVVTDPLNYKEMIALLSKVKFVISDSGGIQEECAALNKKILVCRNTTERPEGIDAGFAKLVDDRIIENFAWANDQPRWEGINPYGNGKAGHLIVKSIRNFFNKSTERAQETTVVSNPTGMSK